MATKKTPKISEESLDLPGSGAELDQAIDDLRGVLKQGGETDLSDFGGDSDFGGTETGGMELSTFGGDFGDTATEADSFGMGDFDGGGAGMSDMSFSAETTQPAGSALTANLDLIMDIPIDVQIVLGSSKMQVSGLMNLNEGAIIALDKKIGEPVEITVNGRKIARGEITVLENDDTRFGVKLLEVMSTRKA